MDPEVQTVELRDIGDYQENSRSTRLSITEVMRAVLALIFAFLLLIIIVWAFWNVRGGKEVWEATKELLEVLLPGVTALLGSAVGFYFGTQVIR